MAATIRASHILLMHAGVPESSSDRSRAAALEAMTRLRDKIKSGDVDFAEAAQTLSDCPSGEDGGDLGHFSKGMMVPEFDKASFTLEVNELSEIVETPFGFHLILRTE
ncbi:peptidylprolyl isomerase [Novispirillum itersonii]|uniref:Parvulin-like PPIase n=1 Tax=Novispirillum itersonii TaxID=189 RepID=A0A7X0DNA1_NOVIT|nr:peptidylprolyl isomerase [Novispirillum itersonii]MBB6211923.1 parvulin-like peptidyl-prolyl isomerase [Novispirillum itersonii]